MALVDQVAHLGELTLAQAALVALAGLDQHTVLLVQLALLETLVEMAMQAAVVVALAAHQAAQPEQP